MNETSERPQLSTVLAGDRIPAETVGAKAAMLDRVIARGAPVPPSGVITTQAFRAFTSDRRLSEFLHGLRTGPLPDVEDMAAEQRVVDEEFRRAPMPSDVAAAIVSLVDRVGAGGPVAVRSSATAEDLQSASFAGQYRTLLDVDADEAVDAVRACWASLWYPGARSYRRFRRVADDDLAMAALIMPMLEPSHAGVVFTDDPTQPGSIRIEVVEGLGETLVSGARTPEVIVVERPDLDHFSPDLVGLRDVADQAIALEDRAGQPLDIEWAIVDDEVWLLQARPITTSIDSAVDFDDGFDVGDDQARYTTAGVAEMLPGVLGPRRWDLNSWLVEEGFRVLFAGLGADSSVLSSPHAMLGRFRGRVAMNLDVMEEVVESVPGGSAEELEHQYFGEVLEGAQRPSTEPAGGIRLKQAVRTLSARSRAYREAELVIQAIAGVLDDEPEFVDLDDDALLHVRHRVLQLGARATAAEMTVASMATAGYRGLELFLADHLGANAAQTAVQRLTAANPSSRRGRRALAVDELVDELSVVDDHVALLATESWAEAEARLQTSADGRNFLDRFSRAVRRAGSMSIFGGETWESAPDTVWGTIRAASTATHLDTEGLRSETLADVERQLDADASRRRARLLGGELIDVRRRFLRREAADTAAFLERREQAKASLLMLGGVLWRADREIGRRLVEAGALDDIRDTDLLTHGEARRCLAGGAIGPDTVARRRRRLDAARIEPPLPTVFRGQPTAPAAPPLTGDVVVGWPGSPGHHEGRARLVESPGGSGLRRGEIIVAQNTDPSWLPLFHLAGAIVVEEGGPLSHASILARELGMPAVLNVPGIVDRIRRQPDSVITVDGSTGEVAIRRARASERRRSSESAASSARTDIPGDGPDGVVPVLRVEASPPPGVERRHVFVTGLIGAGAMMSFAIGVTQAVGQARSRERIARRARPRAEALAAGTIRGFTSDQVGLTGLRSRSFYAWIGAVALIVASLAGYWSIAEYAEEPDETSSLWQFAFGASTTVMCLVLAAVAAGAARGWPSVSAMGRRLSVARTHERLRLDRVVGTTRASSVAAMVLITAVLALLVAEEEGALRVIDEWIYDLIGAGGGHSWWYPDVLGDLLRKEVMIPLAVALTIASYRCKPLLLMTPLAIACGGVAHLTLQHFFTRERPGSVLTDAFPGGRTNELTIMLGLLPVVVHVLTRRRDVRVALEVLCGTVWIIAITDQVRVGDHWPTDNLAGVLIGASIVVLVRGVLTEPEMHGRCNDCPAQRRHGGAP